MRSCGVKRRPRRTTRCRKPAVNAPHGGKVSMKTKPRWLGRNDFWPPVVKIVVGTRWWAKVENWVSGATWLGYISIGRGYVIGGITPLGAALPLVGRGAPPGHASTPRPPPGHRPPLPKPSGHRYPSVRPSASFSTELGRGGLPLGGGVILAHIRARKT
ncbi:hypothetical protein AAG570_002070 [Ranatra chinensis]|uniref:Uncharacterized protein n=1 Tax=Ranatra chinensis TaxID=642074 RepID=A0ABD0YM65_9HEMI